MSRAETTSNYGQARGYAATVLAVSISGLLIFFATSRDWARGRVREEGLPTDAIAVTGSQAHPLVAALALVVAAAGLAILSTRGRVRQGVGALVVTCSVSVLIMVLFGSGATTTAFDAAVEQSTAFTGENSPRIDSTWWPWAVIASSLVAGALGVLTVLRGRQWPTMGRRYEAPQTGPSSVDSAHLDPSRGSGSDIWKAIDEGRDPTL